MFCLCHLPCSLVTDPPGHYGIIYHVHHPSLSFSNINIIMQMMYIKGTRQISVVFLKDQIN